MKTYTNLFEKIVSFENLLKATRKAQRGKRFKSATAVFNLNLEKELFALQKDMLAGTYRHGGYRDFYIHDPKRRLISAAPYRDRVVHHALCNIIEPVFDRTFIYDSYACRTGKGTHAAVERYTVFARKNSYVLKCDIQKYFQSMDHEILMAVISRKIRCERTLWLLAEIIGSRVDNRQVAYFKGDDLFDPYSRKRAIPIGNLTSQFFANVYLNGFDHFVKEKLCCKYYIRYVDDFVVFGDSKEKLRKVKVLIEDYLGALRLRLHPGKCRAYKVKDGISFLGYRIFPTHRLLNKGNALRMRRRLKKMRSLYREGKIELDKIQQRIQSWIGHAAHADTYRLRRRVLESVAFQRGITGNAAGGFVEQQSGQRPLCEPQQEQPEQTEQQYRISLRQDLNL
ncbi:MAG: reverse transcriptase/maturase family protein [Desulfobacterales bacterium]|nr:reverse transcriptase/maturase family protein [Desulfobacterales bacterium]